MEAREPKEDSGPAAGEQADPVTSAMTRANQAALRGDFGTARAELKRTRSRVSQPDQTRLDALDRSFRVDRAALVVIGLTIAVLVVIGLSTLFH